MVGRRITYPDVYMQAAWTISVIAACCAADFSNQLDNHTLCILAGAVGTCLPACLLSLLLLCMLLLCDPGLNDLGTRGQAR